MIIFITIGITYRSKKVFKLNIAALKSGAEGRICQIDNNYNKLLI
jgi:hypothetical protein